ncbi:MAG: DUF1823 family protein [Aphanocapsa sp. GSE-SYN-MK-11-07L]|nr:DUF1823 family protein [Aphanocapsa sp. GSE-SYN-MK-11-07L]
MTDLPALNSATCWQILDDQLSDQIVNALLWHCLGYQYDPDLQQWNAVAVAEEWSTDYPQPPDFIGSRPATVKLTRSIPAAHKQLLKEQLGFTGYQVSELNPRLTRRATAANWLLSYLQRQTV